MTENYIRYHKSDTPIIILSVHGGSMAPPGLDKRACIGAPVSCDCSILRDRYTQEITERCVQILNKIWGEPSVIIDDISRLYIDFNRNPSCAYKDLDAKKYYDTLHNKIREFVDDVRFGHDRAFLFDIHGTTGRSPDLWDAYIGTLNGNVYSSSSSVKQLLTIDPNALSRLHRLFVDKGYKVQPSKISEKELYQGAYILKTYGSNNSNGINAVQFEIDDKIRNDITKRNNFAYNLAFIISKFVNQYIR